MNIFNGLKYYDLGFLMYDLWVVIVVFLWCTIISLLINKTGKFQKKWDSSDYLQLFFVITLVLIEICIYSITYKCTILAVVLITQLALKKKTATYFTFGTCLLLGFGFTLFPLIIAIFYAMIKYFTQKSRLSKR